MTITPRLMVIAGPTASGKTDLAERLAGEHGGEILNADSQQFYRGMDVGTGKLPLASRKVRHWLYDLCAPGEAMTAMAFARQADQVIVQLAEQKINPILVGGTGLYLRALLEGLDPLPERNSTIRYGLEQRLKEEGAEVLHRELAAVDPVLGAKVHPKDRARLIRFLEVFTLTNRPPSEFFSQAMERKTRYPIDIYWLKPDRNFLRERIRQRVRLMLKAGWLEETQTLLDAGFDPRTLPNKPIGYADLAEVLSGGLSLAAAEEKIVLRTGQYAKRQETFFRGLFARKPYQQEPNRLRILEASYYKAFSLTGGGP